MPVLVHAAHRPVARTVARHLLAAGGQVRATAADGVALLRAEGVFTAACDPDDEGILEAALTQVHTLVVLLGGLGRADVGAVRAEGLAAARAADGAAVQRAVLVTLPQGREPGDPLRRVHAEVAGAFAALPLPSVEVRTGLLDTPATTDLLLAAGLPEPERSTPVAPVDVGALAALVVAIDDARSRATGGHLVVAADGPDRRPLADHVADATARTGGTGRLAGRRVPSEADRSALLGTLAGPWWTDDADIPDAWSLFDVAPDPAG